VPHDLLQASLQEALQEAPPQVEVLCLAMW
jgi:hypothetical protein